MKILKIKTLSKEWADRDRILLHAAFQVLVDFIEKEKPEKIIEYDSDQQHRKTWKELTRLYRWWKKERPKRKSPLENPRLKSPPFNFEKIPGEPLMKRVDVDRKKYKAYYRAINIDYRLEQKWEHEDQQNLHRLIDIRRHLWC